LDSAFETALVVCGLFMSDLPGASRKPRWQCKQIPAAESNPSLAFYLSLDHDIFY
jgi:hypothetical protein